jgi:hypothetical protein
MQAMVRLRATIVAVESTKPDDIEQQPWFHAWAAVLALLEACRTFDGALVHAMLVREWQAATTPDNAAEAVRDSLGWDTRALAFVIDHGLADLNDTIVGWSAVDELMTVIYVRGPDRGAVPFVIRHDPDVMRIWPNADVTLNPESIAKYLGSLYERPGSA